MESWSREIIALAQGDSTVQRTKYWLNSIEDNFNPERMRKVSVDKTIGHLEDIISIMEPARKYILKWLRDQAGQEEKQPTPTWLHGLLRLMDDKEINEHLLKSEPVAIDFNLHHVRSGFDRSPGAEQEIEEVLQAAVLAVSAPAPENSPNNNSVEEDFNRAYIGSAHQTLHETLSRFDSNGQDYAAVFPILQSSGVGKSRTVIKLADHAPGILLCVRPPSRPNQTDSMPGQDKPIYEFLTSEAPSVNYVIEKYTAQSATKFPDRGTAHWIEWIHHLRVAALLAATVTVFRNRLHQAVESLQTAQDPITWKGIVEVLRSDFTNEIVRGYRVPSPVRSSSSNHTSETVETSHGETSPHTSPSIRRSLIKQIAELAEGSMEENEHLRPPPRHFLYDDSNFRHSMMGTLRPLLADIQRLGADMAALPVEGPSWRYFFIALDEFATVSHLLTPIRRVMSALTATPLRLLLLDTNIELASVVGPDVIRASNRTSLGEKSLCEPHIVISHDIQLHGQEQRGLYYRFLKGEETLTHEQCRQFIRYMGRPLWSDDVYRVGATGTFADVNYRAVLRKMGCESGTEDGQILALAAARLPLHISGLQGQSNTRNFVRNQISQHLRCVVGFDVTGDIVYTNTPSEPIMSFAAASRQRSWAGFPSAGQKIPDSDDKAIPHPIDEPATKVPFAYWSAAIRLIRAKQLTGVLNVGENGEEYIRLILTIAMDAEASQLQSDPAQPYLPGTLNLVNLGKFLERFYGDIQLEPEYEDLKERSWLHVTHFVRMGRQFNRNNPLKKRHLLELFSRGAAGIGIVNQGGWDIVIPVYYHGPARPGPHEKIDVSNMRLVIVQTKVDPTQTLTAMKKNKFLKTIAKDAQFTSLCLFFNLAHPHDQQAYKEGDMYCLFLGGRGKDRFPTISEFPDRDTQQSLIGLIGHRGTSLGKERRGALPGSQAWRDLNFRLTAQGMHEEDDANEDQPQDSNVSRKIENPADDTEMGGAESDDSESNLEDTEMTDAEEQDE